MVQSAILGFGVVGSGVAEIITGFGLPRPASPDVGLKYILDVRDFPDSPFADCFVKDFGVIESDPEVGVVIETIGGMGAALAFTERALMAGKSVVTSNKELVANHGRRLMAMAAEHGAVYLFEASTGGGIPLLRPMSECMAQDTIQSVCGIVNGTANYIFTRMLADGVSFADALKGAQANGYAEKDPTADIEGHDTCRKLCILSSIAFGWHLLPDQVPTEGITKVTLEDAGYAASCGCKIKLLARGIAREDGKICAYVAPHLVEITSPLGNVDDVFNAVTVDDAATGRVMFYGRGAGKLPTASAVVADVLTAAKRPETAAYAPWAETRPDGTFSPDELASRWYVRLAEGEPPAGDVLTRADAPAGECAVLTPPMARPQLEELLRGRAVLSVIRALD